MTIRGGLLGTLVLARPTNLNLENTYAYVVLAASTSLNLGEHTYIMFVSQIKVNRCREKSVFVSPKLRLVGAVGHDANGGS